MRVVLAVIGLLVVIAAVALSARSGLRAGAPAADSASAASAPADLSRREGHKQLQHDLERSLQQSADKALQSGY